MAYKSIISYSDIVRREDIMLQRGMNYRIKHGYSIILMSVRKGAPYKDRWHPDTGILEYEGHDELKRKGINPKKEDQPLETTSGRLTENGKFFQAAADYKAKKRKPELVQVYEKISSGIWCDRGKYELIDAKIVSDDGRKVCRFFLRPAKAPFRREPFLKVTRAIPTPVKVEVWKRDQGKCVICGSKDNLHFDHDVPYSKGGSSITAKNVRLLCARHNLSKSDKIMSFAPWFATIASAMIEKAG
ncbi:MAG: HNH endonuclease [Planctomycetes bacterium HGW-Planctomycetes-1]|nr:MAG: HNH endonuclease [Planctomycetes bacterium HGW-Planctomycetes-1]